MFAITILISIVSTKNTKIKQTKTLPALLFCRCKVNVKEHKGLENCLKAPWALLCYIVSSLFYSKIPASMLK